MTSSKVIGASLSLGGRDISGGGITTGTKTSPIPLTRAPEEKIKEIRRLLNEPEKLWHYISASNMSELLSKIRENNPKE